MDTSPGTDDTPQPRVRADPVTSETLHVAPRLNEHQRIETPSDCGFCRHTIHGTRFGRSQGIVRLAPMDASQDYVRGDD